MQYYTWGLMNYIVYCAYNRINHKVYVGITKRTLTVRIKRHYANSKLYKYHFANALRNNEFDHFQWFIVASDLSKIQALDLERHFILELNLTNREWGYNSTLGGEGGNGGAMKGRKHSPETKNKMSISHKNRDRSAETYDHLRAYATTDAAKQQFKITQNAAWQATKIPVIDDLGNIFESISKAAQNYGTFKTAVHRSCKTKGRLRAAGRSFNYANSNK